MNARMRPLTKVPAILLIGLFLILSSIPTALATVDHAQQTGQPCSTCHHSPQGGGALTPQGVAFARGGYEWPVTEDPQARPLSPAARLLRLIAGYVHITVTVVWLGTIFYIHLIVRPQRLATGVPKGERNVGWISIGLMTVTGIILTLFRYLEVGSVFSGTFGTVFIIKLVQFGLMVTVAALATLVFTRRLQLGSTSAFPSDASGTEITSEALPHFSGKEGARALIAVDGKLYDVTDSRLWKDGVHARRHAAGQDLTKAMQGAPHGREVLERMPMVGELRAGTGKRSRQSPLQRIFVASTYAPLMLTLGILFSVAWWKWGFSWEAIAPAQEAYLLATLSEATTDCIQCHTAEGVMTAQIAEWQQSAHAPEMVGCYECHQANPADPDAMDHNGYRISVLVTPVDCGRCHVREVEQFAASRHSQAADILASLDNVLGERVEGLAAAVLGCWQCHGAPIEVMPDGTLSAASWPNTGMGRINPDGSRGACSTCHTRHLFSVAVARAPDSCGNCHLGPDHPQKEIYEESKHGVAFVANLERMNLKARPWVLGQDYTAAPTCATCHMSALPGIEVNHDVGQRIAWTLRPAVSTRLEEWEARRERMATACRQCHSPGFYRNFFAQFDNAVELYNSKFARPAGQIMAALRSSAKLTPIEFDEQIEWTYFYLWHHEGRRARHGAAMMGPDYTQWHGFFEVADRFYNEFLPEAEALLPGVTDPYLEEEYHQWLQGEEEPMGIKP